MAGAYQPIQMPGSRAAEMFFGRFDNERDRIRQSEQDQLARQQQEALMQRQKQADFQQAYLKAQQLAQGGDMDGARALLAPYVQDMQLAQEGAAPAPSPASADPPRQLRPPETRPLPEGNDYDGSDLGFDQNAPPPVEQVNPVMAARQHQQAQRSRNVLRFRDPTGQQLTMDPEGQRERAMAQRMERLDSAFGGVDPETAALYQEMRPALAAFDDVNPSQVFQTIRDDKRSRAKAIADAQADELREKRQAERDAMTREGWDRSDARSERNARIFAGAKNVTTPVQDAAARMSMVKAFNDEADNFAKSRGMRERAEKYRGLQDGWRKSLSSTQGDQIGALYAFARSAEGGSRGLTDADFRNIAGGLKGGKVEEVKAWFQQMQSGHVLTPKVAQQLAKATQNLIGDMQKHVAKDRADYQKRFGPTSEFGHMPGNVDHKAVELFGAFDEEGGDVLTKPAVQVGIGNKVDPRKKTLEDMRRKRQLDRMLDPRGDYYGGKR